MLEVEIPDDTHKDEMDDVAEEEFDKDKTTGKVLYEGRRLDPKDAEELNWIHS